MRSFFTSESVTSGQPDKLCDKIADTILDYILSYDVNAHVACEVSASQNKVYLFGETSTAKSIDYAGITRKVIADAGYEDPKIGFDSNSCEVIAELHEQSPDIARGIDKHDSQNNGAGDQGIMYGYACRETEFLMPFPITYAHRLTKRLESVRRRKELPYLRPDGKSQVTVEYENGIPKRFSSIILSAQHQDNISTDKLREELENEVILPVLPEDMLDNRTEIYINPTGRFVRGGPIADTGMTGRKIMVDTYGGYARHGGGSFSGKDASKVDRSGAYMARYLAKNIVAAGLAVKCEIQLSYSIGLSEPTSLEINDFGTGRIPSGRIRSFILKNIDMRPKAILNRFHLERPIYSKLSCYGHFGENANGMLWEECDITKSLEDL